jgi:hypothetical protein
LRCEVNPEDGGSIVLRNDARCHNTENREVYLHRDDNFKRRIKVEGGQAMGETLQ